VASPTGILEQDRELIEQHLRRRLEAPGGDDARLGEAVRYAVLGGGKRLRPILALWSYDAVSAPHPTQPGWRAVE
jgi:farnesyl diphosphate synthase